MKLEVGMYVRIQWGNGEQTISRCTNKVDMGDTQYSKNDFYIHTDKRGEVIYKSMIVKASHNIEELLKKGDYVNGYMITDFDDDYYDEELDEDVEGFSIVLGNEEQFFRIPPKDIKTVLTKEQFEAMQYKVVEQC